MSLVDQIEKLRASKDGAAEASRQAALETYAAILRRANKPRDGDGVALLEAGAAAGLTPTEIDQDLALLAELLELQSRWQECSSKDSRAEAIRLLAETEKAMRAELRTVADSADGTVVAQLLSAIGRYQPFEDAVERIRHNHQAAMRETVEASKAFRGACQRSLRVAAAVQ